MFKKIPKEEWIKLSKEEQDYFTFEFNKSVEKRKRITLITTRTLALLCIFMLFWIGFVQFKAIKNYNEIIDIYGNNGYCYLCGEKTLKACECQYFTNEFVLENQYIFDNYSKVVADYNGKKCSGMKVNENERYNQFLIPYDLSFDS